MNTYRNNLMWAVHKVCHVPGGMDQRFVVERDREGGPVTRDVTLQNLTN